MQGGKYGNNSGQWFSIWGGSQFRLSDLDCLGEHFHPSDIYEQSCCLLCGMRKSVKKSSSVILKNTGKRFEEKKTPSES
ncbi:hypothetical protein CEXT_204251 [Caerostris extrusa]|uniref:Uncharacterized protein n=1 Tax=Caerostris extrusa TaxID=172846 RepID=A0AAV4XJW0_CAEEX|nr:hypothetical protein CEXT_204251 [Caerostris extrusa]